MVVNVPGKHRGGPWYSEFKERAVFERGVREFFPALKIRTHRDKGLPKLTYTVLMSVPHYNHTRQVTLTFSASKNFFPAIFVAGPSASPHRYDDNSLCIWRPWDPKENRWLFQEGLLSLLVLVQIHLFKEAWWREHDEWLGPEVPHGTELALPK